MALAAPSLPKRKAADGDPLRTEDILFCPLPEAAERFSARTAGTILFLSDGGSCPSLAFAARMPRALSIVLDGPDALPLFAAPDGVGAVFAAGREETVRAARFFAAVRDIPCAVAPSDGACDGVFGGMGSVFVDGEAQTVPLAEADLFCDTAFMAPSLGGARARVALAKLARFEARALTAFGREKRGVCEARPGERAAAEEVVRANIALRLAEADGAWPGEGAVLFRLYPVPDAWRAFCELTALYAAFFGRGRPRKYFVPDYRERARRAGVPYAGVEIPTPEEVARRALILEERRADFGREIALIARGKSAESDSVYAFSKKAAKNKGVSEELKILPERSPDGLAAVIRDFGLMEIG